MPARRDQAERVARQPNRRRFAPSHEDDTDRGQRGHCQRHGRDHPCRRPPPLRRRHNGNGRERRLRDNLDQPHRRLDPFEPARSRGGELDSVDALREIDNGLAGQNLARGRDRAQPRGQVQRPAPIAALGRHRLAGIQPYPDAHREDGSVLARRRAEPPLKLHRRPQRLPRRPEHAQGLIAAQLQELARKLRNRASHDLGERRRQVRRRLVALLLRKPRVAAHIRDQECPQLRRRDRNRPVRIFCHDRRSLRHTRLRARVAEARPAQLHMNCSRSVKVSVPALTRIGAPAVIKSEGNDSQGG